MRNPHLPDGRVRVASVPARHPYVEAIVDPSVVDLLPDPPISGGPAQQWWPPRLLEPEWVAARTATFDLLHVHFGLESHPVHRVARAVDEVRRAGRPVVYTVHDLENPQVVDQAQHREALEAMISRADALVTLTDATAAEVRRTWGRSAQVVPHPRLHRAAITSPRSATATLRIATHLRDLRPNIDGVGVVATLVRAIAELRTRGLPVVAEVHLNTRVRDERVAARIADLVAGRGGVELHRHDRLDDDELATALSRLDAFVLPYAWGTHSGWVELAYDAALPVVGTDAGAFGAQHPEDYHRYALGDPPSLAHAIEAATSQRRARTCEEHGAEVARRSVARDAQLVAARDAHSALYLGLLSARTAA